MNKAVFFILLLHLSLVRLEAQINKEHEVPLQLNQASCPDDDKFEWRKTDYLCAVNNQLLIAELELFKSINGYSYDAKDFVDNFLMLFCNNSNFKWERFKELYDILKLGGHNILVEDCIGDHPIAFWNDLFNFQPNNAVKDRLKNKGYRVQYDYIPQWPEPIKTKFNLDYYPIEVTKMPINFSTGQPYGPDELLEYIRLNLNDFIDITKSKFIPIAGDESLWNSPNPLGAIIGIIIPINSGAVVCSDYDQSYWVFTTVVAPPDKEGFHPVSGNRQFGYEQKGNNFIFFTKGCDVAWLSGNVIAALIAYNGGEALWSSFQTKVNAWIIAHLGEITTAPKEQQLPSLGWLIEALKGNSPITKIPCK